MNLDTKILANIFKLQNPSITQIPKNAFGVFATIRRSIKLPDYPEDIHGCIGYWSPDYAILSQKDIISHLIDVSHSALNNDERRKYFPPIKNDPDTIIEIDFMLQPLIPVNDKTGFLQNDDKGDKGDKFINSKYGLIVNDISNGSRATYLPNVFPDTIVWSKLKASLMTKADR
jgi:AMMECR1 domain-containing protein